MTQRVPAVPVKSMVKLLKRAHRDHKVAMGALAMSLKTYARSLLTKKIADALTEAASAWFKNKGANFSKLPLGLGRTRKRRSSSQKKQDKMTSASNKSKK